jgi:hypothetical protein
MGSREDQATLALVAGQRRLRVCCSAHLTLCKAMCRLVATGFAVMSGTDLQHASPRDRRISGSPIPGTFFHAQNWGLKKMQAKERIDE